MHLRYPLIAALSLTMAAAWADSPADTGPEAEPAVAPDADIYVYPSKGQTEQQLDRDRYECHNWATKQSHYDPGEPRLAPHQRIQVVEMRPPGPGPGAVVGAVTGAIIGDGIAGRHDGGGALAGAIVGSVIGAQTDAARARQSTTTKVSAEAEAERARLEKQASDYRRAISACLEGRGYTVK